MNGGNRESPPAPASRSSLRDLSEELELTTGPWVEAGLDDALARIDRILAGGHVGGGALSFDADMPAPERELLESLSSIGGEAMSFSVAADASAEGGGSKASRFLDKLLERAGATARIDTRVAGRLVAATVVGIAGDFASTLDGAHSTGDLELHLKALDGALGDRRAWMRLLLSTLQAATKIALAAGMGSPLVALPAAWRFIRGVMAEWQVRKRAA